MKMVDIRCQPGTSRLASEAKHLVERWKSMLDGIEDDKTRNNVAVLLENQRLMNGCCADIGELFHRLSIPLVSRVFRDLIISRFVHVEAMLGPTNCHGAAQIRRLKTEFASKCVEVAPGKWVSDEDFRLASEELWVRNLAANIQQEITNEVITDLLESVPVTEVKDGEFIDMVIGDRAEHIERCSRSEKQPFLVVGSLTKETEVELDRVIVSGFPKNHALVVSSEAHRPGGYTYCPYVPFTLTNKSDMLSNKVDPPSDNGVEYYGILTRYGKRLYSTHDYALVKWNDQ